MKKVFLSSTSRDLENYRQSLYDAIEGLQGYHCVRMENFGARAFCADEVDNALIAESDLFIGLVGNYYGSTPEGGEKSYTELEYEAAARMGKPRLMFLSPPDFGAVVELSEAPEKKERQRAFRTRVALELVSGTFTSPLDLSAQAVVAIFNWERENSCAEHTMSLKWSAVPTPPSPYFVHPYPLQDYFTGRTRERNRLRAWLAEGRHPILMLLGIGGMGKSALTWVWTLNDVLAQEIPSIINDDPGGEELVPLPVEMRPEGVFWWSFYETDATFPAFVDEALVYVTGGTFQPEKVLSYYYKARTLFALLQQRRVLVVFDGFERMLNAYAGMGGGYRADSPSEISQDDPYSCVDPLASKFLRWVASSPMNSRILATSRLFPKELEGFDRLPLPGCRREDLDSLSPDEAVTFFHSVGVQGTRYEIKEVCAPYGYHALTLRLLSGYIVNHFLRPGDIKVALKYNPIRWLIPRRHNILELAYNALDSTDQQLLSKVAAFRSPVDYTAVKALSEFDREEDLEGALGNLIRRGLLFFDRDRIRFDLHPVVRRYAYERLADKRNVHNRLRDYFTAVPSLTDGPVTSVEGLSSTVELFHHTIRAGLYSEAFKLYKERLCVDLQRLGAFLQEIEILEVFLDEGGGDVSSRLKDASERKVVLHNLGIAYGYIGRLRRSLEFFKKSLNIEPSGEEETYRNAIGNIAYFQMKLGELSEAERIQRRGILIAAAAKDLSNKAYGRMRLGLILSFTGKYAQALEELREASIFFHRSSDVVGQCHLWTYRVIRAGLIRENRLALFCAHRSLNLALKIGDERLVTRSQSLLASALLNTAGEYSNHQTRCLSRAELLLVKALANCRKLDLIDVEVNALLNWARWHQMKGDLAQALGVAEEALAIATRCEYRLEQANIYNLMATLALDTGDTAGAHKYAEVARTSAWCDGPSHHYSSALDEADRILASLCQ